MTVDEAAKELEVSPALVYRLCRAGRLGHRRIGLRRGVLRIDPAHVEDFKRKCEAELASGDEGPTVKKVRGRELVIPDFFGDVRREKERERLERRRGTKPPG